LFVALCTIISAFFTNTIVFLPNYSSGNIKTKRIQPISACLAFFEAIWHFFESGLAFFVHLDLETLDRAVSVYIKDVVCCVPGLRLASVGLL